MSDFKTYRTKDGQTWEVDGKPYLLTEMSEGERNALMLATMYKSGGGVDNIVEYEERIEVVTGWGCIICAPNEILMKEKEQSENWDGEKGAAINGWAKANPDKHLIC